MSEGHFIVDCVVGHLFPLPGLLIFGVPGAGGVEEGVATIRVEMDKKGDNLVYDSEKKVLQMSWSRAVMITLSWGKVATNLSATT